MQEQSKTCSFSLFIGRVCISIIFILAGIGKFFDYEATSQYMAAQGMTMIPFFLISAGLIEILGGLSLLLGYYTRFGATVLILFLIPVTYIFHSFWAIDGAAQQLMMIEFLKNLAIFGGLFYVLGAGPGRFSIDGCGSCCKTAQKEETES